MMGSSEAASWYLGLLGISSYAVRQWVGDPLGRDKACEPQERPGRATSGAVGSRRSAPWEENTVRVKGAAERELAGEAEWDLGASGNQG